MTDTERLAKELSDKFPDIFGVNWEALSNYVQKMVLEARINTLDVMKSESDFDSLVELEANKLIANYDAQLDKLKGAK